MSPRKRQRWVVIPRWETFQHYRDRDPLWIKAYTRLLHDPDWLELTAGERSLLLCIWLEYASSHAGVPLDTGWLRGKFQLRVTWAQLERLKEAGWIRFAASRPLALTRVARDRDREDPPNPPQKRGAKRGTNHALTAKQLRRFTGCRHTRGSHGAGFVHDPLGTDKPPPDWPHPKPVREEVLAALVDRDHLEDVTAELKGDT